MIQNNERAPMNQQEIDELKKALNELFENSIAKREVDVNELLDLLTYEQKAFVMDPKNILRVQEVESAIRDVFTVIRKLPLRDSCSEHIASGLMEHFFERYFQAVEGHSCSSDKAKFVIGKVVESIKSGAEQSLFADYSQDAKMNSLYPGQKAFWSPETVQDTKEAKKLFWDWYFFRKDCFTKII